jgi:hypothetical protein
VVIDGVQKLKPGTPVVPQTPSPSTPGS